MASYCTILINPATRSDVLAACIQAAAAIQAGETQADATLWAGGATFLAGLFALVAGWLAYRAATEQTRLSRQREESKAAAYVEHLTQITSSAMTEIDEVMLQLGRADFKISRLASCISLRDETNPSNWERHALLGKTAVRRIISVYQATVFLIAEADRLKMPVDAFVFQDEIRAAAIQVQTRSEQLRSLFKV